MKEHKLAAIVFTDIVGYTKRMESDEEKTMQLLARQREIVYPLVKEYGGEVIKEIGDGLLMMFTSANKAVRFAMAVQDRLKDDELTIRAGIHIGDVIFEGGDVFGSAVNIAARIEPLALPGGICISEDVRNQIRNQGDILTSSCGKKELKGVNEPVEIFRVGLTDDVPERIPFFKDLWTRRVIQVTAIYIILAYLIRLSVAYIVKEYMLSPYLVDLVWYLSLALIPSTVLIAYFHGRRGVSRWSRVELIGLPVNLVLAVLLVVFLFKGKDLGAATTTVTVQDEEGTTVEKTIFKNEFRKSILVFNLENKTGDPDLDYLQFGIPIMEAYDLSQDLLISPRHSMALYTKMVDAGYKEGVGLPLTLMKRYAEKSHMNHFLAGELTRTDKEYILEVRLYDTKLTRQVAGFTVSAETPFDLTDQLTTGIKKALGLPQSHIDQTVDLPVSEIFTDSEMALSYFTLAMKADALKNWEEKVRLLDKALEEDPGFAVAYMVAAMAYFNNNDIARTQQALQEIMDRYLDVMPERNRFGVKYLYYILNQEPDKAFNVVKMWVELFPDDIQAHESLAMRYSVSNMQAEAIAQYKEILRLDPEQYEVLSTLGSLYMVNGNNDSALVYFQRYARMLPQDAEPYRKLGTYYAMIGEFDAARENYENALVVADANEKDGIMISLGNIQRISGQFEQALEQYLDVLGNAKNATDSATAYSALEQLYLVKGQVRRSLEYFELKVICYEKVLAPKEYAVFRVFNVEPYIYAGETDRAFKMLEELAGKLEPPMDKLISFAYMDIYAETGDTAKAEEAMVRAEGLVKDFGEETLNVKIYYAKAKVDEIRANYGQALEFYKKILGLSATSYDVYSDISRCYRHLKEFKKAEEEIQTALKFRPFNPINNYEAGLLYLDMGDLEKARSYLQQAVEIWKDADSDHEKATIAREKLASI